MPATTPATNPAFVLHHLDHAHVDVVVCGGLGLRLHGVAGPAPLWTEILVGPGDANRRALSLALAGMRRGFAHHGLPLGAGPGIPGLRVVEPSPRRPYLGVAWRASQARLGERHCRLAAIDDIAEVCEYADSMIDRAVARAARTALHRGVRAN